MGGEDVGADSFGDVFFAEGSSGVGFSIYAVYPLDEVE